MCSYLPALLEALNERLVERCILRDGLDDVAFNCHVANSPLAHSCAAQTKDIAWRKARTCESQLLNKAENQN